MVRGKGIIFLLTALIAIFSIVFLVKKDLVDQKNIESMITNNDFYFSGKIKSTRNVIGSNYLLLIQSDSIHINPNPFITDQTKIFFGLKSAQNDDIIFLVIRFPDLDHDITSFDQIQVCTNSFKIYLFNDIQRVVLPLELSVFYNNKMIKFANDLGWSGWTKF
ncbi:MAG: hypothetical protein ACXITV_01120 [Luteibaculaceae bacterium]